MNRHCHCTAGADSGAQPPTRVWWSFNLVGWLVPSVILALLPKCPACLAAYVALGTGVGLSLTTAASLKTVIIILCVVVMLYSAARLLRRLTSLRFTTQETAQCKETS